MTGRSPLRSAVLLAAATALVVFVLVTAGWLLVRSFASAEAGAAKVAAPAGPATQAPAADPAEAPVSVGRSGPAEDALALAEFPPTPPDAEEQGPAMWPPPADVTDPVMTLPAATSTGSSGVATGFPRTPQGAVAQLAAAAAAGFAGYDPATMTAVFAEMAVPGQPVLADVRSAIDEARANRTASGFPADGPITGLEYEVEPAMGMVRGTSAGGDFVAACVLSRLTYTRVQPPAFEASALPFCARMWWVGDGWRIEDAPVLDPAPVWPGRAGAYALGWQKLRAAG